MTGRLDGLPRPTADLDEAKGDIDEHGYCLLAEALTRSRIEQLRTRLIEQAAGEKRLGDAFEDGGPTQQWGSFRDASGRIRAEAFREEHGGVNQRVWMLVNKGAPFVDLLEHEQMHELVRYVLGEEYLLSSYTANIAKPGGVAMDLHTDQWFVPEPTRRGRRPLRVGDINRTTFDPDDGRPVDAIAPAVVSNVIFMLDDFTESNGATRVVPGSHLAGRHPNPGRDAAVNTIGAVAPAGTALVTDGRLWHGTGANVGNTSRHAVLATFCGPQFRTQENFTVGVNDEVLRRASPRLATLLGFKVWWAYGRTGNPTVELIDRDEPRLGELSG